MQTIQQSVVAQWNELQLEVIREGGPAPTPTTYQLHLANAAIYDAYAALSPTASGHYSEIETSLENNDTTRPMPRPIRTRRPALAIWRRKTYLLPVPMMARTPKTDLPIPPALCR
jgi:hypothetical protein